MSVSVNDTFFIAPNITITSDTNLTGANILITNLPDDATISYTNVAGITVNHDATNDIYTMTGNASAANYQTLLRSFEMTTGSTTAADIKISFTLNFSNSNALYNVESGHYYEYVTYSSTWTQANTNANTKTFNERQGYLTTITQQSENDFIYYKVVDTGTQNHGWLGANDIQNEGTWRWVTGPEADTIFWQGGSPINEMFQKWQPGEPNNAWGGEHYLILYAHLGTWNDSTPATTLPGYIIEYGGLDSDSITGDYEETITLAINNRYNVTFDSNTGSGTMTAQAIIYDSSAALSSNTFTKTGYTFSGWNTASDGSGTAYNDGASFTMSVEGDTLYAQWSANSYNVTFNSNTGSGTMSAQAITYDSSATLTTNSFIKTGYTFSGWNTASDGSGTAYNDDASFTMNVEGITLYAQWTANSYNVTFDSNTGSGTMSVQAITYDSSATLTTNSFIKTGYTFSGWNTESDGSGTAYNDGASFTMSVEGDTLYAQWTANSYNVTFDSNTGSGTMTAQAIIYDSSAALTTNTFIKTGYTFSGWNTAIDGSGTVYNDGASFTMSVEGDTLYAQWQINTYTITFDTDGGSTVSAITQDYDTEVSTPSDPTKEGYTFDGWSVDVPTTMPATDTTLTALWQINTYTITFDTDGGSEVENLIVAYLDRIQLNQTTSKEGHVFLGWQYNQEIIDHISMPSQDIELIALFELIAETMFTITFDSNGGNTIESIQLKFNDDIPNIATPEKTGFTFIGWYNYHDDTLFTDTKMQSKSINLYAKWRINTYTVTFHFNNNEDIIISEFVYEQKIDFPASPTKIGFDFLYWSLDYQNTLENTIINMPAANISLYAIYEARVNDLYVITTQGVLYTEIISNQEINAQINISLPKGYVFMGWYTAPFGQGDIIDRNNPIQDATNIRIYPYIVFQNNSELSVNGLLNTTPSKATNPNMWIMNSTICISFLSVVYILNKRKRWKEKIALKKE